MKRLMAVVFVLLVGLTAGCTKNYYDTTGPNGDNDNGNNDAAWCSGAEQVCFRNSDNNERVELAIEVDCFARDRRPRGNGQTRDAEVGDEVCLHFHLWKIRSNNQQDLVDLGHSYADDLLVSGDIGSDGWLRVDFENFAVRENSDILIVIWGNKSPCPYPAPGDEWWMCLPTDYNSFLGDDDYGQLHITAALHRQSDPSPGEEHDHWVDR